MKIAWIGTGVMGRPMALHLAKAGYEVHGYNRTYAKVEAMEPEVIAHKSIAECIEDADIIFTIVGFPKDVEEVYEEIFTGAKKGCILVDMTTSSPTLAQNIATKAAETGLIALDAPVTGGDLGAQNATLSIMVGGDHEAYQTVLPLLETMGKTINYLGASGSGQHAKLANQTAIAGALSGIAEALAYAHKHQLDLDSMLDVVVGGSATSWQAENNGPKMIHTDYEPGFYIKHFLKDLRLILVEKEALELPIVERVAQIYDYLSQEGYEDSGTQAIIEFYKQQ